MPAVRSGALSGAGGLTRECRMSRSKQTSPGAVFLAKIAAGLLLVWLEDILTLGLRIGLTLAMGLLTSYAVLTAVPRVAAYVYLTDGHRDGLLHLDDSEYGVDLELTPYGPLCARGAAPPTGPR
ncbi:hypothetical protein ACIRSJ_12345 [Streptomyces virginiae]|uniref:hypothetical protein n=1 Tax=Streptomyces virginiae TaxID=1961 RepID=UPI00380DDFEC